LKILIYTHEFPPFRGGAGVYSYDLAVGLAALDQEVHVLTASCDRPPLEQAGTESFATLHIHYLTVEQTQPAEARRRIARLQFDYGFDLMIVSERRAQEIAASMPMFLLRYVAVIHGTEILDYFCGSHPSLAMQQDEMRQFYEAAELCIAVSRATLVLAQRLIGSGRAKFVAIQNGINLDRLPLPQADAVARVRAKYGSNAEIVFCLGRLDLDKGQDNLMRAFRQVRQKRPQAFLLIGGDGPTKDHLVQLRRDQGLENCVELIGSIPSVDLPAYFQACDLFALTSRSERRWEGFGLVYLEAGHYGKAVLGGNEGGVPEAIADQVSGLIVAPRDEEAIASALLVLLEDNALRNAMGENGRQRVRSYFNSARMATETLQLLRLTCKTQPTRSKHCRRVVLAWHILCETLGLTGREFFRRYRHLAGLK
jgi:phosphatidylinositol alpha-1,6-mannosyltransferase